ncbi:MAG: DNA-directed RNA polymerase [Candidatus Micrarchaeia archaeon]
MYYKYTIKDTLSIPPSYFGEDINKVATTLLREKYERILDRDMGIILVVYNVRDISDGYLLPGDPSTHHDVTFDALTFKLEVEEVVVGEVSELVEFGCFVRIGPLEGLVHLSQITSDFISFDRKSGVLSSRNTGRVLKKGDVVYAKVSTISWKSNIKDTKIALTMRPEGLGKEEWLLEEEKPQKERKRQQKKK